MHAIRQASRTILGGALVALCALSAWPAAAPAQDSVETLYQDATQALDQSRFERAAELYAQFNEQYHAHALAQDALYWEAFARYRMGRDKELMRAAELLEQLQETYPTAQILSEAEQLAVRIQGQLATRGHAEAAERIYALAQRLSDRYSVSATDTLAETLRRTNEEPQADQVQIAALNALLHMDAARARPILLKVVERKDEDSRELRSQALFILAQSRSDENRELFVRILREDPDPELRQMALHCLAQSPDEQSLAAIEEVLRSTDDPEMKEQALFALSQRGGARARDVLRQTALDRGAPAELRAQAIFWLGQEGSAEDLGLMKQLYGELDDAETKEQILFAVSRIPGDASRRWLMDVALDGAEPVELRARSVFWAGQSGAVSAAELHRLYRQIESPEMREQLIFVLSRQDGPEAVETLMSIAREEQDVELKSQAVFWLGQSGDPRVADFIAEIIDQR